ncbi:uncharacterized protein LOC127135212 isoform X1 [Lathyrus oleraceus]|uniref:uncharacterized protein LOC127135212 isoform X1 n=1 Tax=Pisum sativum TaxID=3888 RepID=UPI0021D2E982|nr:uncharacterized protein LOC127135212 isoform X1 [Pisum sativum]
MTVRKISKLFFMSSTLLIWNGIIVTLLLGESSFPHPLVLILKALIPIGHAFILVSTLCLICASSNAGVMIQIAFSMAFNGVSSFFLTRRAGRNLGLTTILIWLLPIPFVLFFNMQHTWMQLRSFGLRLHRRIRFVFCFEWEDEDVPAAGGAPPPPVSAADSAVAGGAPPPPVSAADSTVAGGAPPPPVSAADSAVAGGAPPPPVSAADSAVAATTSA